MAAESPKASRESRAQLRQMLGIGAIASVLGIALGLLIDWFPAQGSEQARSVDTVWDVLIIASVPVFVLVETIVIYSVWKFRMRPGEELKDGPPIHGNTTLEIVWTAFPAIILVALCAYGFSVLTDIEKAQGKDKTLKVHVSAEQFAWSYTYPASGGGKPIVSNQLYLPKDKPIYFEVTAKDVIHSFWVPAFRMKTDAVPGIKTHVRVTPNRLGTYPVVCAELCGIGHSVMRSTAHVVTPAAFAAWLKRERAPLGAAGGGATAGGGAANAGKAIFTSTETACGSCHTLADAGTSGKIGPDLGKFLKGHDKAFIHESIVNPNAYVEKGFPKGVMPGNFGQTLSPQELSALVDYLTKVTR
ncbi:MAG: cytochrome c oxidase subunit [Solirubrobacteraceae bacterium]|nr:cytochrome c oxidase subunit [Solirubrobacteraceae bacterium]